MKDLKITINDKEVECLQGNSFDCIYVDEATYLSEQRIIKIKNIKAVNTQLERSFNRWLSVLFMVYEDRNNYI